jgi:1-acyl-sn-glycerol-3-phosphate acyltransferase
MHYLLAPLRAVVFVVHVLGGLACVLGVFPLVSQATRNRIIGGWSRFLIAICGARLAVTGVPLSPAIEATGIEPWAIGRLALANHVSWIDVFAIDAATPARFVAKAEIGRWPLLGALVTRSGTLYIERGRRHAVATMNRKVREHLRAGETIVVFPEGTTTDGSRLLSFHSNLVAPAIEVGAPVWPIAVRYLEDGTRSTAAAFIGEMGLVTSLARILVARGLVIEVAFLPPIEVRVGANRHAIARAARAAIAQQLGLPLEAEAEAHAL